MIAGCGLELKSIEDEDDTDSGGTVSTPVFDHESGSAFSAATTIGLSCGTENAKIYYTLDGSVPTNKSYRYVDGILVAGQDIEVLIRAKAFRGGMTESAVSAASYSIHYDDDDGTQVAPVVISLESGVYPQVPNTRTVTLSCATPGADIYYTAIRDGLFPTLNWDRVNLLRTQELTATKLYTGPFTVTLYEAGTIQWDNKVKAIALKTGMRDSPLSQAHYRLAGYPTSDPLIPNQVTSSVSAGEYTTFTLTVRDPDGYEDIKRMQLSIRVSNHGTTSPWKNPEMLYFAYRPDQFGDDLVFDNNNNLGNNGAYCYRGPYGSNEIIEMEYYFVDVSRCSMAKAGDSITFTFCVRPKAAVYDKAAVLVIDDPDVPNEPDPPPQMLVDLSKIKRMYCWLQDGAAHDVVSEVGRWDQRP